MGEFAFLRDRARKEAFLNELTNLIADHELTVIASAIRKDALVGLYRNPENPYQMALGFGLERIQIWLEKRTRGGERTPVILERRGPREDEELEREFRRICGGRNFTGRTFPFEPRFVPKAANIPGLQLADLIARPIGRHVLDPGQKNRAYEAIQKKLDRNPAGQVRGWGLKIFP